MNKAEFSKGKLLLKLTKKCEMFFYPFVLPLGVYFVYFTGGFEGETLLHLVIGTAIAVSFVTPVGYVYLYRKVAVILDAFNDENYDGRLIKIKILHLPWIFSLASSTRWIVGGSIAVLYCSIATGLTLLQVIPFLLIVPLLALIHFSMAFFNVESELKDLLSIDKIRDTRLKENDFRGLSFTKRVLLTVIPVAATPMIVLGYQLILMNLQINFEKNISLYIMLILFLSAATIALLAYFMTSNIKVTVRNLHDALDKIKDGRLDLSGVPMITSSEIGMISQSANSLIIKLRDVMSMVQRSAEIVSEMSSNIQEASGGLSQAANEQAASVEEILATVNELLSTVKQNAESAGEAENLADNSYKLAENGNKVMDEAVNTFSEVSKSAEKISSIIEIINSITFQTNILSLNAAIEAARAGEHGRSFSVVAGEVRNLAQRSAESSKEIAKLIEMSVNQINDGAKLAKESGSSLKKIYEAVSLVHQMTSEINNVSGEQKTGLQQIADSISQTSSVTQENASAAEELSVAADSLRSNASELKDTARYFTM
ncbi:MAG: hypothetical protein JW864_11170 [Spirochaetes bacterium]|nr:hypothetical protein [Spirochaetota bacterium]